MPVSAGGGPTGRQLRVVPSARVQLSFVCQGLATRRSPWAPLLCLALLKPFNFCWLNKDVFVAVINNFLGWWVLTDDVSHLSDINSLLPWSRYKFFSMAVCFCWNQRGSSRLVPELHRTAATCREEIKIEKVLRPFIQTLKIQIHPKAFKLLLILLRLPENEPEQVKPYKATNYKLQIMICLFNKGYCVEFSSFLFVWFMSFLVWELLIFYLFSFFCFFLIHSSPFSNHSCLSFVICLFIEYSHECNYCLHSCF